MTEVINIRSAPSGWKTNPQYVYIGRAGHGFDGYFGNPRSTYGKIDGANSFESYARHRMQVDPIFKQRVAELYGKTLVCFCKPLSCHGDILVLMAEELNK